MDPSGDSQYELHLTELWFTVEQLDLVGMHEMEDVRQALLEKIHFLLAEHLLPEPNRKEASASISGQAAVEEPKGEKRKLPQDPEKFFEKVLLPKLQEGQPLDLVGSLAAWVPVHLKQCPEATYDALRVRAKTITAAYDSLTIYGLAEQRSTRGVRLMLKVKSPNGRISQAGSHVFPLGESGFCPKHAHLYLDMLHLLARACQHQKADLDQVRAWHDEVKLFMGFIFDED